MGDPGSYGLSPRLDIQQLLLEAKHRWLRPAEICEILRNYQMFRIESEPPHRPPSGSLFLFDRKVLRYFRKDGHNWRKKKDGKTVKEAHEKLKVGSIDVLHCYYAHGEENENFQRRSYWMLEDGVAYCRDLMHIVFVHYLEVKGTRTNVGAPRETDVSSSRKSSPTSTSFSKSHAKSTSGYLDSLTTTSSMTSLCEDADSEDGYQATSNFHSFPELATAQTGSSPLLSQTNIGFPDFYYQRLVTVSITEQSQPAQTDGLIDFDENSPVIDSQKTLGTASWEEILQQCTSGSHSGQSAVSTSTTRPITSGIVLGQENINSSINFSVDSTVQEDHGTSMAVSSNWQIPVVDNSLPFPKEHVDQLSELETVYDLEAGVSGHRNHDEVFENSQKLRLSHLEMLNEQHMLSNLQHQLANRESQCLMKLNSEKDLILDGNVHYASTLRQSLLGGEEALKKVDSFSRWISRELGDVDDLRMHPSPGISWSADECGNIHDESSLSPSLSQDQLFSITDYSPKWSFTDMETEVLIVGRFLGIHQDVAKCNWSCMFGEVEVPAMVLADGILCCRAPPHSTGQVPFYVTFSNRLACSEVREFQYLAGSVKDVDVTDIYDDGTNELLLHRQLDSLLSLNYLVSPSNIFIDDLDKRNVIRNLIALKEEKDYIVEPNSQEELIQQEKKKYFFKILMKEMLYSWLLHKVVEDGKGPNVWDENGQGVIHLAAALGYDWAMEPIVSAGVSINFRDVNGWTALHWAAFCGREQTVAALIALGSGAGLLTDPSSEYPLGRSPADLASAKGHKGISGFLAESSLTSHLSTLTMNDTKQDGEEVSSTKVVRSVSERIATPANDGYLPGELSLKDSITAVSHATQVADRIHQMFRIQSFQRKQFAEHNGDQFEFLDDRSLSIVARALKGGQGNGLAHSAAIHIQKKFRGWKKRKEFLLIRQRIVKIQAHVRGHQVRKKYPSMTWSIGIVDTLLRWRRKGSGPRPMVVPKEPTSESIPEEDDNDFLKKGRRQTEERLRKALTRVKSMAQDPQGRDQYRRLLTLVHGMHENKVSGMAVKGSENRVDEALIDLDDILDDDTLMSITFD